NWSTALNWSGGIAPTGSAVTLDDLSFPAGAARTTNFNDITRPGGASPSFNSITIAGSNYNLTGNKLILRSPSVSGSGSPHVNGGASGDIITLDVQLGGAAGSKQFFTIDSSSDLTIAGHLSGTTGVELTKAGTGILILNNDNSGFTGPISLGTAAGVLRITNA